MKTLQAIKSDTILAEVPVIIFTTSNSPHDKERAMELGADAYLVKPYSKKEYDRISAMLLQYGPKSPN